MRNLILKYRVSLAILTLAILCCGGYLGKSYLDIQKEMKEFHEKNTKHYSTKFDQNSEKLEAVESTSKGPD